MTGPTAPQRHRECGMHRLSAKPAGVVEERREPPQVNGQLLSARKIDKRFTGVHALRQVDFDLDEGEIHALVGENGAGKSTLMKVLVGINSKGLRRNPLPRATRSIRVIPSTALEMGIGIIHQELNMMEHLTVAREHLHRSGVHDAGGVLLDKREQNERAAGAVQAAQDEHRSRRAAVGRSPWASSRWWRSPRRSRTACASSSSMSPPRP